VTVVVRGREQLAGLQLQVRQGTRLVRTVRVRRRARALAISWPPSAGKRCQAAPAGHYRLRVTARDVAGNIRAVDVGAVAARGVVFSLPDRAIVAGRRVRVGISSDARGLRLELARLGGKPAVLARGTHAPAAVARVPAGAAGGIYLVSNRHAGRTYRALLAVRGASRARVALLVGKRPSAVLAAYQRRLDGLGIRFDALTSRDAAGGALGRYTVVVAPPGAGRIPVVAGVQLVRSLAGIKPGLGA
jgi:hypothetical protein